MPFYLYMKYSHPTWSMGAFLYGQISIPILFNNSIPFRIPELLTGAKGAGDKCIISNVT